jgi:tetratricopeptide (TPR) repeat protein
MFSQEAKQFTVFISTGSGCGSGILVPQQQSSIDCNSDSVILANQKMKQYWVLTAAHVVNKCHSSEQVYIKTFDQLRHYFDVNKIRFLSNVDLALVRFHSEYNYPVSPIAENLPNRRETIYFTAFGYFGEDTANPHFLFQKGEINASTLKPVEKGCGIVYSPQAQPGMSGGAVLNQQGELIGICSNSVQKYSLGVPIIPYFLWIQGKNDNVDLQQSSEELTLEDHFVIGLANSKLANSKATRELTKVIHSSSDITLLAGAYLHRGFIYLKQGKSTKGIRDLNKAIDLDSLLAEAYFLRGAIYVKKKQLENAIADLKKAILINPHYADAYSILGDIRRNQGKLDKAFENYNYAIHINPNDAILYYKRASAHKSKTRKIRWISQLSIEEVEEMILDLDQAIRLNPNYAAAYLLRGAISGVQFTQENLREELRENLVKESCYDFKKVMHLYQQEAKTEAFNAPISSLKKLSVAMCICISSRLF